MPPHQHLEAVGAETRAGLLKTSDVSYTPMFCARWYQIRRTRIARYFMVLGRIDLAPG